MNRILKSMVYVVKNGEILSIDKNKIEGSSNSNVAIDPLLGPRRNRVNNGKVKYHRYPVLLTPPVTRA